MLSRDPYRRHSAQFKLQVCSEIRSDKIGRRDAQKTYAISANLIQMWLTQYDRGELDRDGAQSSRTLCFLHDCFGSRPCQNSKSTVLVQQCAEANQG
jgi:transposase-like protein